ncbi:MAG: aldo/keto reductase [Pseudomonadota bacterium]
MNRLALGTVQFGLNYGVANRDGQVTRPVAKSMLGLARENGVDTLDTAIAYGDSEACLGEVGTEGFKVVSKLPGVPGSCADIQGWVREQVDLSLARLGLKTLHGVLLHRPEQLLSTEGTELFRALLGLKDAGLVKKIGISIYEPGQLKVLTEKFDFDLVQAPLNLVDRRLQTTGWLQALKDKDIEVHTRSAFLQGLLLMKQGDVPERFSQWSDVWLAWHQWLLAHGISAVRACLAYPLSLPGVDRLVVGADSVNQLQQILREAQCECPADWPDVQREDEDLINPARWASV